MKIYTKTGDKGETGLFGGERVPKDALRIEAYGAVDELNSLIGVIRSLRPKKKIDVVLKTIQQDLFILGADLAAPNHSKFFSIPRITLSASSSLEKVIDAFEVSLAPLKAFILPGGTVVASHLHLARTVCRRAERSVVRLSHSENVADDVIVYLNRLSDLLFVLARYANRLEKKKEVQWVNPSSKTAKSKAPPIFR
jgi:cob(I)alamin adenosyltransferase